MHHIQTLIIVCAFSFFSYLIHAVLRKFGRRDVLIYFLSPIGMFCIGFYLRLNESKELVDIGYFFTESSYILVYTLFSIAILLGQLKYWKK